ncbi:hypothetical protein D8780_04540 [Notoacmeibacter ruber]|uniref:Uncharacterized protein n=1 Tax=Notoacmeibacter ruber TaxID=2670375 RepID=A0A3L7JAT0_9HYPH|nr:hypothetical protein D8780_04540 [Notoacmeibacter ruber]
MNGAADGDVGVMTEVAASVSDLTSGFLPASVATLVGSLWWLLLLTFLLSIPLGWKLAAGGRRR